MWPSRRPFLGVFALVWLSSCGDTEPDPASGTSSGAETGGDAGGDAAASDDADVPGPEGGSTEDGGDSSEADEGSTSAPGSGSSGGGGSESGVEEDLDMQPDDFTCLLQWPKVRRFRITNLLGRLDEAVDVAENPAGGVYPVGTVIQLIPTEAMVKRAPGFSAETNDWEFFFLGVSGAGTTIEARGTTEVINGFGGNCYDCHAKAEPQWDLVCETGHGCDPIPLGAEQIEQIQQGDPRCP